MVWGLCFLGLRGKQTDDSQGCGCPNKLTSNNSEAADPEQQCWICLEGGTSDNPLHRPCGCPRAVHESCIARWQLQSAGREEECYCRFCRKKLPDWKQKMTPENVTPSRTAVMAVVLNGEEHRITVEPGRTGRKQFEREIRRLFHLSQEDELEFTFDCQTPGGSDSLQLQGKGAFEAAFHCAAVTAALREQHKVGPVETQ